MDVERPKVVRVAAYLRVSTEEQAKEGYGLKSQLRNIEHYVKCHEFEGWVLEPRFIYKDEGVSGTLESRPALDRLLYDAKNKEFDLILVWKIDRLFRSMFLLLKTMQKLVKEYGVACHSMTERFDATPVGEFMFHIFGALAQFERNLIIERTKEGKISSAKEGKYQGGGYPYGYKMDDKKRLMVLNDEAKWVRTVFRWFTEENMTIVAIAEKLRKLKVPRKRDGNRKIKKRVHDLQFWHPGTITKMLRHTHYIGHYYYNKQGKDQNGKIYTKPEKEWLRFTCPTIIDKPTYIKALRKLDENRLSNNADNIYLLSAKIQCGECGAMFTGYTTKNTKHYRCNKTNKTKTSKVCKASNVSETIISAGVWDKVKAILKNPKKVLDKLEADYKQKSYYHYLVQEKDHLEKRRVQNQDARANIRQLVRENVYGTEEAAGEIKIIERQYGEIMESLEAVNAQLQVQEAKEEKVQSIKELAKKYGKNLDKVTYDHKRTILQAMVKRIVLTKDDVQVELQVPKVVDEELNKSNDVRGVPSKNRTCI